MLQSLRVGKERCHSVELKNMVEREKAVVVHSELDDSRVDQREVEGTQLNLQLAP
jgi:hypothetical protein